MNLDWRIRLLDRFLSLSKPVYLMSREELQTLDETQIPPIVESILAGRKFSIAQITELAVQGRHGTVPLRLYHPDPRQTLPLILFFHGGGWVYGNLDTYDRLCRRLAHQTGAAVLAVRYRLAPDFKYPTALDDCEDALSWALDQATELQVDATRLFVMGDSAGGNLAASLCLMCRNWDESLVRGQILIYPVLDGFLDQPSVDRYADAPVLTKEAMQKYVEFYARSPDDLSQPYFSPLQSTDFSRLPPALIITAEYDILYDQAQLYAQKLQHAGTAVKLVEYPGMVHGFLSFPPFCRSALPAFEITAAFVRAIA